MDKKENIYSKWCHENKIMCKICIKMTRITTKHTEQTNSINNYKWLLKAWSPFTITNVKCSTAPVYNLRQNNTHTKTRILSHCQLLYIKYKGTTAHINLGLTCSVVINNLHFHLFDIETSDNNISVVCQKASFLISEKYIITCDFFGDKPNKTPPLNLSTFYTSAQTRPKQQMVTLHGISKILRKFKNTAFLPTIKINYMYTVYYDEVCKNSTCYPS